MVTNLFILVANVNNLKNFDICSQFHWTDSCMNVIVTKKIFSQSAHFFWPSGTVEQNLSIWSNLIDNFTNLGLKTHVKHTISFIQNLKTKVGTLFGTNFGAYQISGSFEISLFHFQEIHETTRCSNDLIKYKSPRQGYPDLRFRCLVQDLESVVPLVRHQTSKLHIVEMLLGNHVRLREPKNV